MSPRRNVSPSCWFHIQTTSCTNHGCLFLCFVPPEVAAGHSVVVEVSPDIHICGFCKQQYNNFEVFLAHKQNGCSLPSSDTSATSATTVLTGKNTIYCCKPACKKKKWIYSHALTTRHHSCPAQIPAPSLSSRKPTRPAS